MHSNPNVKHGIMLEIIFPARTFHTEMLSGNITHVWDNRD